MPSTNLQHEKSDYIAAIKKLFPLGVYWDMQFDDPSSDLSLWATATADEVHHYKGRFAELIRESVPKTANNTLGDWERVLLGAIYPHLPLEMRSNLLISKRRGCVNRTVLQEIAKLYGATIKRLYYPYRSAFFGHSRIGITRMCSPASFSVFFVEIANAALKLDFERTITEALLANMIIYFFYT